MTWSTDIQAAFRKSYGQDPEFAVRTPGRLNIIGEHIDYSGFGVLPMAIHKAIVCAVGPADDNGPVLTLRNVDPAFPEVQFNEEEIKNGAKEHSWAVYFLCGYRGVVEDKEIFKGGQYPRMNVLLTGDVPQGSGLSSSSALVCAAVLSTAQAAGVEAIPRPKAAKLAMASERYVGVESGGMDQSISLMGREGMAKYIEFVPALKATDVPLPSGIVFVVSNTLVESHKYATAGQNYNARVAECRIAAQILNKRLGLGFPVENRLILKNVSDALLQKGSIKSLNDMTAIVDKELPAKPITLAEVADILGISSDQVLEYYVHKSAHSLPQFAVHARAKHVYEESQLVLDFLSECERQRETPTDHQQHLQTLGQLMLNSHAGCRSLFECSCPELDELVSLGQEFGTIGSRLTGAGWGGAAIHLVHAEKADALIEFLRQKYYAPRNLDNGRLPQSLFATTPSEGGQVVIF
eukprot:Clim_evm10s246 gene=Clim_evmTU10s246